jgi:hypothetical protein
MKTDKIALFIFTASLFLVLLPHTLYSFVKKRLEQPKLSVQIELSDQSHVQQKGISKQMVDNEPLYVYEIFWRFKLSIRNDSQHSAFHPEIPPSFYLPYYSSIEAPAQNTIAPLETIITKGYHSRLERCKKGEHANPNILPKELAKAKLLLSYQNQHKITFYTVFDIKSGTSSYHRFMPFEFRI